MLNGRGFNEQMYHDIQSRTRFVCIYHQTRPGRGRDQGWRQLGARLRRFAIVKPGRIQKRNDQKARTGWDVCKSAPPPSIPCFSPQCDVLWGTHLVNQQSIIPAVLTSTTFRDALDLRLACPGVPGKPRKAPLEEGGVCDELIGQRKISCVLLLSCG